MPWRLKIKELFFLKNKLETLKDHFTLINLAYRFKI